MSKSTGVIQSSNYRLESLLAVNDLCQSWQAVDRDTGVRYFVKIPNPQSNLEAPVQDAILAKSFDCQRELRHRGILTAWERRREDGRAFIAYPFLEPESWQVLSAGMLAAHFEQLFPEMCLLTDYLHLQDLVHCDLKLDNFLVSRSDRGLRLILADLDFLCPALDEPNAKVFGTPEHIAPEILANEPVMAQSDVYSLGVSLRSILEQDDPQASPNLPVDSLGLLFEAMTQKEALRRPRVLINALQEHGIIDEPAFQELEKRLLAMILATRFRQARREELGDERRLLMFFRERCRMIGLPAEFTSLLASAWRENRHRTWHVSRAFFKDTAISRHGDFWIPGQDDATLARAFKQLTGLVGGTWLPDGAHDPVSVGEYARRDVERGKPLAAYLKIRDKLRPGDVVGGKAPADEGRSLLELAGSIAKRVNRLRSAISYHEGLAGMLDGEDRAKVQRELVQEYSLAGAYDKAIEMTYSLKEDSAGHSDGRQEIAVERFLFYFGKLGAEALAPHLKRSERFAKQSGEYYEILASYYTAANFHMYRGEFSQAADCAKKALETGRQHGLYDRLVGVLLVLCSIYYELADYGSSLRYGRLCLRLSSRIGDTSIANNVWPFLTSDYLRLGLYGKANYCLSQMLSAAATSGSSGLLHSYYLNSGHVCINSGRIVEGQEACIRGTEFPAESAHPRAFGKLHHNLAEAALQQGDVGRCDQHLTAGRAWFDKVDDQASLLELNALSEMNRLYNQGEDRVDRLADCVSALLDHGCRYYALLSAFHVLLMGSSGQRRQVARSLAGVEDLYRQSDTPLFQAVALMASADALTLEGSDRLPLLKDVLRVFLNARLNFLAVLTGEMIAGAYLEEARDRLGRKYLVQVRRLAEALGNKARTARCDERLASLDKSAESHHRLVQSMHGISQILRNIRNYDKSLERLVEFAVNETGAERGALLLRGPEDSRLHIAAYFNCDEGSLEDIRDISSSVPMSTTRDLEPLVVENALIDERTRNYKSVVYHNILSVISVPIEQDGQVLGALYLDHHTIPALFETEDVTYVFSIANFIALMLTTLRQYKDITVINRELMEDINRSGDRTAFVTKDPRTLEMLRLLPEIARSDAPVLLLGESGTGKEILSHKIHQLSMRSDKPILQMNCAALAESMIESELFGIAKGAATGVSERDGKFSAADGGTLFLDEIGDMPASIQAKVLRVLEDRKFEKVGSNRTIWTDIRFLYATNRDLERLVKEGQFRKDLYYRITTFTLEIPPLRERRGDIPLLLDHFRKIYSAGRRPPRFTREVVDVLVAYDWPGNVRELRNLVERLCIVHQGREVEVSMLPEDLCGSPRDHAYRKEVEESIEAARVREALEKHDWHQSNAAKSINMALSTFRRRMKKYGIRIPRPGEGR